MREQDSIVLSIVHAESLALGEANRSRANRMLGLIAIGFSGLTALAAVLLNQGNDLVFLGAPFVILLLWFTCVRLLTEMYMTSVYRKFYDEQITRFSGTSKSFSYRSWQSSASRRGTTAFANVSLFAFVALSSLLAIGYSAVRSLEVADAGWWWTLVVLWSLGIVAIVVSVSTLPGVMRRIAADLRS